METEYKHLLMWYSLIVAIVGDFAVPYILARFYRGYSHKTMLMSSLGNRNSPVKTYYNAWLIVLGVLLTMAAFTLYSRYVTVSKPLSIFVAILVLIFALGAGLIAGMFSVSESKEDKTIASQIHGIGSASGFTALLFAPLFIAPLSFKDSDIIAGIVCGLSFIAAFLFFMFFIMAEKTVFENTMIAREGLWQRLTLLFIYVPFGYIAVQNLIK